MKKAIILILTFTLIAGAVIGGTAEEIQFISPYSRLEKGQNYIFAISTAGKSDNWRGWVQDEFEGYKNFQYLSAKRARDIFVLAKAKGQLSTAGYHGMKIASDFQLIFEGSALSNEKARLPSELNGVYETNLGYIPDSIMSAPINGEQIPSETVPKSETKYAIEFNSDTLHEPDLLGGNRWHTKVLIKDFLQNTRFLHLFTGIASMNNGYKLIIAFTLRPSFSTDKSLYELGRSWATEIQEKMEAYSKDLTFSGAYKLLPYRTT